MLHIRLGVSEPMRAFIGITLVLALVSFVTGCQEAGDPKDKASNILAQEADFPGSWAWSRVSDLAHIKSESQDMSKAARSFSGTYEHEYVIRIFHLVKVYSNTAPPISEPELDLNIDEDPVVFSPQLLAWGEKMNAACGYNRSELYSICVVIVQYPEVISSITVYAPRTLSRERLVELLNSLLAKIDARIQSKSSEK